MTKTEHEARLAKAILFNKELVATKTVSQITTEDLIRADSLTSDEITLIVDIYPSYIIGKTYIVGDLFKYNNELYEVLQAHTSQEDWIPSTTLALYKSHNAIAIIPEWVQPINAETAYNIGDKVIFEGSTYESLINANVWSPIAYPAGWKLI